MKWWLTCIRKYVTFEGRARRKEYWMFTLFNVVFVVVTMLLDILVSSINSIYPLVSDSRTL